MIRKAKRQHFAHSVENLKDTSTIWRHLRAVNKGCMTSEKTLPGELIFDEQFTDSQTIASKFNEFFTSIAQILDDTDTDSNDLNVNKLREFANDKVPDDTHFSIPFITTEQDYVIYTYFRSIESNWSRWTGS